jgi:hypothetical protein
VDRKEKHKSIYKLTNPSYKTQNPKINSLENTEKWNLLDSLYK